MKKFYPFLSLLLLISLLASCTAPPAAPADAPVAEEAAASEMSGDPVTGGTLRAAFQNEWAGLDPHVTSSYSSYQVLNNVLEGLTTYDDEMNLMPLLAESWEQSDDGLT